MAIRRIILLFFMLLTFCAATNYWYPSAFEIQNLRLDHEYAVVNETLYCYVDVFPINDTDVVSASFVISGAGVNITASDDESIGAQLSTDSIVWNSSNFTANQSGILTCNVSLTDAYGTTETLSESFRITDELGSCGSGPNCTLTASTEVYPGIYHYYLINVTGAGVINQDLTYAENTTYGDTYTFYVDDDFILSGDIDLDGSGVITGTYDGMPAGSLYIYINDEFQQSGTITGNGYVGVQPPSSDDHGGTGGAGLNIYVQADLWTQSGPVTTVGAGGGQNKGDNKNAGHSADSGEIQFTGRNWLSSGAWTLTGGTSANCATVPDNCNGGHGGEVSEVKVFGFLNKTAGNVGLTSGTGSNGKNGGTGGEGGDMAFLNITGRLYWTGGSVTYSGGDAGDCDASGESVEGGRDGGDGNFLTFDGTDMFWNTSSITVTLGDGANGDGAGGNPAPGGDGGDAILTGNATFHGIKCRDTCNVISQISMNGGAKGTGDNGGADGDDGDDAGWEVWYNRVGASNDFTKLLQSRTTYNFSGNSTFERNSTLSDVLNLTLDDDDVFALEIINASWNSTNPENQTLYWQIRETNTNDGNVTYLLQNNTEYPTPVMSYTNESMNISTNRYDATIYSYEVRTRLDYYRFTSWSLQNLTVKHANSTISATRTDILADGTMDFTCNYTGYDFYLNGTKYEENTSLIKQVYHGQVSVQVENNGSNTSADTTYDTVNDLYEAEDVQEAWKEGEHEWWCVGNKTNYQSATNNGSNFTVDDFSVWLPLGYSSIDIVCIFPTITDIEPHGQGASTPIITVVNNNYTNTQNYTLGLTDQPTNATIYFSVVNNRTTEYALSNASNKTICENVPSANTTACQAWLWTDCAVAPVGTLNVSYYVGEQR